MTSANNGAITESDQGNTKNSKDPNPYTPAEKTNSAEINKIQEVVIMLMPSIFGENLFDGFFDDFGMNWPERRAAYDRAPRPAVMKTDVKESETGYELDIDLPGYGKDDVKAELKDGYLTITAKKETDDGKKDEDGKYIRRERYYGSCSRSYFVGKDVEQEDIKAKFENGILKISVPKKEAKPKIEEKKYITIEG